jgi:ribosomal protein S18 acetylase RimI-like enzyme
MTSVVLIPASASDREFLYRVYASTRQEELAPLCWPPEQVEGFLRMQFDAQSRHYQEHYSDAAFDLIKMDNEPIGRLYVLRRPDEIRIVDIALLPMYRGRGIGTHLMNDLIAESTRTAKLLRIHVEVNNPAHQWYERLGFIRMATTGVYDTMERQPGEN